MIHIYAPINIDSYMYKQIYVTQVHHQISTLSWRAVVSPQVSTGGKELANRDFPRTLEK